MKYLVFVAALGAALVFALSAEAASTHSVKSCTFAELTALQIPLGFHGWTQLNIRTLAALDREKALACAKVPARWAWTNREFKRATGFVDRLYPGMAHGSWADSCASSEGGHGGWVWNGGAPWWSSAHGSGAGGWLQFMQGTFNSVIGGALARARAHGVRVPYQYAGYYDPVGQAIAGSEMLFDGRRGEFNGAGC